MNFLYAHIFFDERKECFTCRAVRKFTIANGMLINSHFYGSEKHCESKNGNFRNGGNATKALH